MAASIFSSAITEALQSSTMLAFTQEICVIFVFFISFALWRHFKRGTSRYAPGKGEAFGTSKSRAWEQRQRPQQATQVPEVADAQIKAAEQQMLQHLEQREFTRALNVYRPFERAQRDHLFGEEFFSAFIQSAARVGKVDVVERMLRAIKRGNLEPSLRFWQTSLKMLSSRKHFTACISAHMLFGRQLPADKVVFSCLINAALELGAPLRAVEMLQRYSEADLDPKDHVLFFRTFVAVADVAAAEAVFRKLGKETSTLMLNLLLLTCVNAKRPDRALELVREAHKLEAGGPAKIVDVVSYNTVVKGFAQANMSDKCFQCLHELLAVGLQPDDITLGTLLDACIEGRNMDAASEVVDFLVGREKQMDTVMCTLFIKGLVRASCLPKALELYEEMKKREGAGPDIVTYSVLIKALVDRHELDRALRLVEDMRALGKRPDDIILTHLLEGCRHAGNHALGKKLFEEALADGMKPSEFTLVTMLKLHGRCGALREAEELLRGWEGRGGIKPSVIHYTCLISGCLRTKSYDQAWATYELMCSKGVAPDATAISTLLPGLVAARQWDRVLALARTALEGQERVGAPSEILNNALSQMLNAGAGAAGKSAELRALMRAAGVPLSAVRQQRNANR